MVASRVAKIVTEEAELFARDSETAAVAIEKKDVRLSVSTDEETNMTSSWGTAEPHDALTNETKWPEPASSENQKFSISEVKQMVMDNIPDQVRDMVPPETWERVFNEASENVLAGDFLELQKSTTEEDMRDLVSYISVYVQREARGGRQRGDSVISEVTNPVTETVTSRTPMDAVALVPIDPSVISEDSEEEGSIKSEVEQEQPTNQDPKSNSLSRSTMAKASHEDVAATEQPQKGLGSAVLAHASNLGKHMTMSGMHVIQPESALSSQDIHPSQQEQSRQIAFSRVEIRYYERILTDNPAVTSGPPIGIGWKYRIMKKDMTIDAWEHRQMPNRRYLTELVIPRNERTSILYDLGYSQKEIAFSVREVLKIKNKRKQTYNNLKFQAMEELVEKTGRRFKKALTLGMAGRKEKKMLASFSKSSTRKF